MSITFLVDQYFPICYNIDMNKANRVYFGTTWFTLPFRVHGYWVEDATGKNVAEAATRELAKAIAETLNAKGA